VNQFAGRREGGREAGRGWTYLDVAADLDHRSVELVAEH
jgi:hypothetical protein